MLSQEDKKVRHSLLTSIYYTCKTNHHIRFIIKLPNHLFSFKRFAQITPPLIINAKSP